MSPLPWKERYLNAFVTYFLLGPVMIAAWISSWMLISTVLIYPQNQTISVWISAAIGFIGSLIASLEQNTLHRFAVSHGYIFYAVISRVYSYLMFFISANLWRSIWEGWDLYTGVTKNNALVTGITAYLGLMVLKCSRQVVFAPCVLSMDFPESSYFQVTTYFRTESNSGWRHILDVFFSIFVVGFLGFTVWRGWWQIMDHIIYPDDQLASGICSLAISYGTVITLTILEPPLIWLCAKGNSLHWILGLAVEDVVIFMASVASITYWRGFWILFHLYIPRPELRYWLGHAFGCIILFFSMAFNSVLARGCAFDGEHTDGQGVVQNIPYPTSLLQMFKSSASTGQKEYKICAYFCMLCAPTLAKKGDRDSEIFLLRMSSTSSYNEESELPGQFQDKNKSDSGWSEDIVNGNCIPRSHESQVELIGNNDDPNTPIVTL